MMLHLTPKYENTPKYRAANAQRQHIGVFSKQNTTSRLPDMTGRPVVISFY